MKTNTKFNIMRHRGNWIVDSTIIPKNSNDIATSVELKSFKFYIAKSGDLLISRREIVKETVNSILTGVATDGRVSVHKNLGGRICMKFSKFMESPVNLILEFDGDNIHQMKLYVREILFTDKLASIGCNRYKDTTKIYGSEISVKDDMWCIFMDDRANKISIRTSGKFNSNLSMIAKIDFTGVPKEERWCKIDLEYPMMAPTSTAYIEGALTDKISQAIREANEKPAIFKVNRK